MSKLVVYFRYLTEYLKYCDFVSIISSLKYLINRKSHKSDRIIKSSVGTFFCRKNTNDFQYANYAYEWNVKKFFLDHLDEYSVFIDGGSCIGEYSILLSKNGIRCFAFEPVPDTYSVLLKNLEMNNQGMVIQSFPYGLGAENAKVDFVINSINTGASHLARNGKPGNCKVDIRTFDSVFKELNLSPDDRILFKLDVEGMETQAISGAGTFIQSFSNITFVIENEHSAIDFVKETLNNIAVFEYGVVDKFNFVARKLHNIEKGNQFFEINPDNPLINSFTEKWLS
ncbi:MAG: FkbM family methyltransferase [Lentimicrobium sp.]